MSQLVGFSKWFEAVWGHSAYGCGRETIADALEQVVRASQFRIEDLQPVWLALRGCGEQSVDFTDYLLRVTNHQLDCSETVTLDKKTARLEEFRLLG